MNKFLVRVNLRMYFGFRQIPKQLNQRVVHHFGSLNFSGVPGWVFQWTHSVFLGFNRRGQLGQVFHQIKLH